MKIRNVVTLAAALMVGGSIALAQGGKAPEKVKAKTAATATDTGKKVVSAGDKAGEKVVEKTAKVGKKGSKMSKKSDDTTKTKKAPAKKPTN
jgi:hypothetical protein